MDRLTDHRIDTAVRLHIRASANRGRPARLTSFDDVVATLGGVNETARLVEVSPEAVCGWRSKTGRFPARHYVTMTIALAERRAVAPHTLWNFAMPQRVA